MKAIRDDLAVIYDDTQEIKNRMMKRDMQNVLALADAESEVTGFLPLAELNAATDNLFGNPISAKAIAAHIWYSLRGDGYDDPPLNIIMSYTCHLLFTEELKAYLYVDKA